MPGALGQVFDTNRRPFSFPASALHATMPWKGHCWLVTAHTRQCIGSLSSAEAAILRGWWLGFPPACSALLCRRFFSQAAVSSCLSRESAHSTQSFRRAQAFCGCLLWSYSPALCCCRGFAFACFVCGFVARRAFRCAVGRRP